MPPGSELALHSPERRLYPSGNPRLGTRGMIADSALQAQNLEMSDERDAIVAVEATGRYSDLVG